MWNVEVNEMRMEQAQIDAVAAVLQRWDPLGPKSAPHHDPNGYQTEAIDIIANFSLARQAPQSIVRTVINQAFDLHLSGADCAAAATEIAKLLR
jgi:hypothetical protein